MVLMVTLIVGVTDVLAYDRGDLIGYWRYDDSDDPLPYSMIMLLQEDGKGEQQAVMIFPPPIFTEPFTWTFSNNTLTIIKENGERINSPVTYIDKNHIMLGSVKYIRL